MDPIVNVQSLGKFFIVNQQIAEPTRLRLIDNSSAVDKIGLQSATAPEESRIGRGLVQNRLPLRLEQWIEAAITRIPFYGFGMWERLAGVRSPDWKAPDKADKWRSQFDDGLIGVRRLAWRDYSSFERWELDDASGRASGMWQNDAPNPRVLIPLDRALHVTYGDHDNPEGLATLEALWRLERLLYAMEIVQGIGFEHTAGHLSVTVEEGDYDAAAVRAAARAIMTAQEGNYAAWPKGTKGEIIDSSFSAADSLEGAIQNRRILKLALFGMQFVAISTMSGAGSYAALNDSSSLAMLIFNSIAEGIVRQADDQLGNWLFLHPVNAAAFPNMTRRPVLRVGQVEKTLQLAELGQFVTAIAAVLPLGDDDLIAIRRASGILPEQLPEVEEMEEVPEDVVEDVVEDAGDDETVDTTPVEDMPDAGETPELAGIKKGSELTKRDIADYHWIEITDFSAYERVYVRGDAREMADIDENKQVTDSAEVYEEEVAGLILQAADGRMSRKEFVVQLNTVTDAAVTEAFMLGIGVKRLDYITASQRAALAGQLELQREAVANMADDIYDKGI